MIGASSSVRKFQIANNYEPTYIDQVLEDAKIGFTAKQKCIPSKYFYDGRGSQLFEEICTLPEYYPTRTELALLRQIAMKLTRGFHSGDIVELGSGANRKVRILLDAMSKRRRGTIRYIPVDVSLDALTSATTGLIELYPELEIMCLVADFSRDLPRIPAHRPKLMLFLGSTIGNLNDTEALTLLSSIAEILSSSDRFLLGLDMVKPIEIMEAAYNDSRSVTAEFNKNILLVLNREIGTNFHPDDFDHLAFFNEELSQIEMHLRAKRTTVVHFPSLNWSVRIEEGETIRTEISRKFRRSEIECLAGEAGLKVSHWYADSNEWFSIAEIVRVH